MTGGKVEGMKGMETEILNRAEGVKFIFEAIRDFGYGLKTAVHIYDYLSGSLGGFGSIPVTKKDVELHLFTSYNIAIFD